MYCDYWNLTKPPFDNVPDASMYVDCHESMENVISETIFAIKEGNECFAVIVGEVGLGKTLSLRVIIDSLEPEKYKVALITNPALSFVQLLREIIGQITGKQCLEKKKVDLLEMFNHLLFETADQGKKIVIVIDESNVLSPSNLDDLRLLTNMQDDERNLFTLLLVGQMELAKTLEHPKRANLFQRIGTYGHLEKLPSKESIRDYIESRLRIAGAERKIFEDSAIPIIWEFSEHGIPRLINKLCKLCMKAGETNEFATISGDVASQIADRFQKLSKTSKAQKRPEIEPREKETEGEKLQKIPRASKAETPAMKAPTAPASFQREDARPVQSQVAPDRPTFRHIPQRDESRPIEPPAATPERPPLKPIPQREEVRPVMPERPPLRPIHPQHEDRRPVEPQTAAPERPPFKPAPPQWEEASRPSMPERPSFRPIPLREEARPVEPQRSEPQRPPLRPVPPEWEEASRPSKPERPTFRPVPQREEALPVAPQMAEPERPPLRPASPSWEESRRVEPQMATPQRPPLRPNPLPMEESKSIESETEITPQAAPRPASLRMEEPEPAPVMSAAYQPDETRPVQPRTVPLAKPVATFVPTPGLPPKTTAANFPPPRGTGPGETKQEESQVQVEKEDYEDVLIGQQTVKLAIPAHVIKQAQLASNENKNKLAGYWAAQMLKGNPSLTHASLADPVSLWFDVKNVILKKFNSPSR